MEEGIMLGDKEGVISFVNPKTTEILNYNEGELIGKHWYSIIAAEDLEKAEIESTNRPRGISGTYELKLLTKDGKIVPTIITATPIFSDGKFEGVLCVFTDITLRVQAEKTPSSRIDEHLKKD